MNRKNEYFIGDFIEFDRQWERSKNVGIVVKKILKSEVLSIGFPIVGNARTSSDIIFII